MEQSVLDRAVQLCIRLPTTKRHRNNVSLLFRRPIDALGYPRQFPRSVICQHLTNQQTCLRCYAGKTDSVQPSTNNTGTMSPVAVGVNHPFTSKVLTSRDRAFKIRMLPDTRVKNGDGRSFSLSQFPHIRYAKNPGSPIDSLARLFRDAL